MRNSRKPRFFCGKIFEAVEISPREKIRAQLKGFFENFPFKILVKQVVRVNGRKLSEKIEAKNRTNADYCCNEAKLFHVEQFEGNIRTILRCAFRPHIFT